MEYILQIIKEPFFLLFLGLMLVAIVFAIIMNKNYKKKNSSFLDKNPTAVKVYINQGGTLSTSKLNIHEIDGEKISGILGNQGGENFSVFSEGVKYGYYLLPGVHEVLVSYEDTRRGVIYKNVTTYTEPELVEIKCEANKSYSLNLDIDTGQYKFEVL